MQRYFDTNKMNYQEYNELTSIFEGEEDEHAEFIVKLKNISSGDVEIKKQISDIDITIKSSGATYDYALYKLETPYIKLNINNEKSFNTYIFDRINKDYMNNKILSYDFNKREYGGDLWFVVKRYH